MNLADFYACQMVVVANSKQHVNSCMKITGTSAIGHHVHDLVSFAIEFYWM